MKLNDLSFYIIYGSLVVLLLPLFMMLEVILWACGWQEPIFDIENLQ